MPRKSRPCHCHRNLSQTAPLARSGSPSRNSMSLWKRASRMSSRMLIVGMTYAMKRRSMPLTASMLYPLAVMTTLVTRAR
eukprot:5392418-Ditylum_brightwellii.AAC.1